MLSRNFTLLLLALFIVSCQPKERPIEYGHEECKYCKMNIVDNRYGTEVVTNKSKVYVFDSVECLVDFLQRDVDDINQISLMMITPFDQPGTLVGVEKAWFLHSKELPSPMGMFLSAFASKEKAEQFQEKFGGVVLDWNELFKTYKTLKKNMYSE